MTETPVMYRFGSPSDYMTPPGSSGFQVVQGAVLSSLMGAGPVSRRYGARHAGLAREKDLAHAADREPADDLIATKYQVAPSVTERNVMGLNAWNNVVTYCVVPGVNWIVEPLVNAVNQ